MFQIQKIFFVTDDSLKELKIQYDQIMPSLCENEICDHAHIIVVCYTIIRFYCIKAHWMKNIKMDKKISYVRNPI